MTLRRFAGAVPRGVWLVAAVFVALELAVSARYGFHRDELYFIVCGRRAALGYVDQPPLAPMVTRVATALFGTSPTAVRVFPALTGAAVVLVSAWTARLLGGGERAQVVTAVAVACAPVTLVAAHLANTTIYDVLAWSVTVACAIAAVVQQRSRAWLGAGVAVGLGLENKDLLLLLVAALALGLLVTGRRRVFADPWLWAGVGVAVAFWAPNVVWQATHGWPEHAMAGSLRAEHSTGSDYVTVVPAQLVYAGVAVAPLAVLGVRTLLRRRAWRFLVVALGVVVAFVVGYIPGRAYYTDGLLPAVFAAGAVALERRADAGARLRRWIVAPVVGLAASVAVILPVLPERALARVPGVHTISYDLTETIGWPQLSRVVSGVYDGLPTEQRRTASVFTTNYGEAAALEVFPVDGRPDVLSGHNSYALWGPGRAPDATVIVVGSVDRIGRHFATCRRATTFHSPHGADNDENGVGVWLCTGPQGPWSAFWRQLRHFG